MDCADAAAQSTTGVWSLPLAAGQDSLEVRASEADLSYEARMAYEAE
ncbi:hypothetical protein QFZ50_001434 [Arthrobacter agilis]|nr:hypothetical protein [Arthrobacter agilis]